MVFHVCFLFFSADKLPFCPSRMRRDFRADIFKRWNALNGGNCVHKANQLHEHQFNQDTSLYFSRALIVDDKATSRAETNWFGVFNKQLILDRSTAPTKVRCSPAKSAKASWLSFCDDRNRRRLTASVARRTLSAELTRALQTLDAHTSTAYT